MKIFKLIPILLLIGVVVMWSGAVYAEDEDTNISIVTLFIPSTANLVLTSGSADSSRTLSADAGGYIAEDAFDAGYIDFDAGLPTFAVSANKSWKLSAQVTEKTGFSNGSYTKPITDLKLVDNSTSTAHVTMSDFTPLSDSENKVVASHSSGVWDESHPMQYRIMLDWTLDIPGTYTAIVTYTLVTGV